MYMETLRLVCIKCHSLKMSPHIMRNEKKSPSNVENVKSNNSWFLPTLETTCMWFNFKQYISSTDIVKLLYR